MTTLDELREREQQSRARLGVGCENPDEWLIEASDDDSQVEAGHTLDGIDLVLATDGLAVRIELARGEPARAFVPAETLIAMFKELRAAIGPTAFEEIYGGIDEH